MKVTYSLLFILTLILSAEPCRASWTNLSVDDGLLSNQINDIARGPDGLVWLATRYGLAATNGQDIKVMLPSKQPGMSQISNALIKVETDNFHNVYFMSPQAFGAYNRHTGQFRSISQGFRGGRFYTMSKGISDVIYIGCDNMVAAYDPRTGKLSALLDSATTGERPESYVRTVYEDRHGQVWIGTIHHGIYRYSPTENHVYHYPAVGEHNSVFDIFMDKDSRLWICSWDSGIYYIDNPYAGKVGKPVKFDGIKMGAGERATRIRQCDSSGSIWISTTDRIVRLGNDDPDNGPVVPYYENAEVKNASDIELDGKGHIWTATFGGGIYFSDAGTSAFNLSSKTLPPLPDGVGGGTAIYEDSKGNLWAGFGNAGLLRLRPGADRWEEPYADLRLSGDTRHISFAILQQGDSLLWIGTYGHGLIRHDLRTGHNSFYEHGTSAAIPNDHIMHLAEDAFGNIWIGTLTGVGAITPANRQIDTRIPGDIMGIEPVDSAVYVAALHGGLYKVDGDIARQHTLRHIEITNPNGENEIIMCIKPHKGIIYIGTDTYGMTSYNPATGDIKLIEAIPSDKIQVAAIVPDKEGKLWAGTNQGLWLVDPAEPHVPGVHFSKHDGMQSDRFSRTGYSAGDRLYFTMENGGILMIEPQVVKDNLHKRKNNVKFDFTDFLIFNTPFRELPEESRRKVSPGVLPQFSELITIPANLNNFSIRFGASNLTEPKFALYSYILEGYDKEWITADANNRNATYTNLPAGEYTFKLKASDENGIWSDEVKELHIKVIPPWYLSWWAIALYVVFVAALGYFIWLWVKMHEREKALLAMDRLEEQSYHANVTRQEVEEEESTDEETEAPSGRIVIDMKQVDYTTADDAFLKNVTKCVESNLDNAEFDVPSFAKGVGVSKTSLFNKLKKLTGMNPSLFIRTVRLQAACRILSTTPSIRVSELAYMVGFNDPKYFAQCFKKEFGVSVSDYAGRSSGSPSSQ